VPREIAIDYQQYLASREWRMKRKEVIELNNGICERCASRPIKNVHHLTYENLGQESPLDLLGVCRPCHEYLSAERDDDPALEIIQKTIAECGLFPASIWPGMDTYPSPLFTSGSSKYGFTLWMRLVPESEHIGYERGYPRKLLAPGVMAIFFWL